MRRAVVGGVREVGCAVGGGGEKHTPVRYRLLASSTVLLLNRFCTRGWQRWAGARHCAAAGRPTEVVLEETKRRHWRAGRLKRASRKGRDGAMAPGILCILINRGRVKPNG